MKKLFLWLYAWFSHSFFSLLPVAAAIAGGVVLTHLIPRYGLILTLVWVVIMGAVYVKYFKWY